MTSSTDTMSAQIRSVPRSIPSTALRDAELFGRFHHDIPLRLWYTKTWFTEITRHPTDQTLRDAIQALICAHGAMLLQESSLVVSSRRSYGKSLRSLRKKVANPQHADLKSMQHSIFVISMFELYDKCLTRKEINLTLYDLVGDGDTASWKYHARGMKQVMRLQGPYFYGPNYPLMRLLYVAMRDVLVSRLFWKLRLTYVLLIVDIADLGIC